jgi:uncharacterized protein (TIGR02246 family)
MKARELLFAALVMGCVGCGTAPAPTPVPAADTQAQTQAKDQADIKALEDRFVAAFDAKDVNAVMACYIPDESLIVFDATPPRQYTGATAYKKDFTDFFAAFPTPIHMTLTDLDITVGGDIAYSHSIQRTEATDKKGKKMFLTVRVTDGYKRVNGQWLISHEHVSVPVDIDKMKPDLDSK